MVSFGLMQTEWVIFGQALLFGTFCFFFLGFWKANPRKKQNQGADLYFFSFRLFIFSFCFFGSRGLVIVGLGPGAWGLRKDVY